MTRMFATVPMPGRWRSGIQRRSTTPPVSASTVPKLSPVFSATPWWKTSQGLSPSPARTRMAMATP
ncbi:MAG TPA: hypothetical protein VGB79_06225 [Allosphingosinicella sp.]